MAHSIEGGIKQVAIQQTVTSRPPQVAFGIVYPTLFRDEISSAVPFVRPKGSSNAILISINSF